MKSVSLYKQYSTLAAGLLAHPPLLQSPSCTPFLSPSLEMKKQSKVHHFSSCFNPVHKKKLHRGFVLWHSNQNVEESHVEMANSRDTTLSPGENPYRRALLLWSTLLYCGNNVILIMCLLKTCTDTRPGYLPRW